MFDRFFLALLFICRRLLGGLAFILVIVLLGLWATGDRHQPHLRPGVPVGR